MVRRIHPGVLAVVGSLVLLGGLVLALSWDSAPKGEAVKRLIVYAAPAVKSPLEMLAQGYEKEIGTKIEFRWGPSQVILVQADKNLDGDLFIPADHSYIQLAEAKKILAETLPIARMKVVLLVHKECPRKIASWKDLVAPGLNLAQTDPDAGAIGKIVREGLTKQGKWDELAKATKVFQTTVVEAANAAQLGSVHAAIGWDAMAKLYPELQVVRLPELDGLESQVQVGVLRNTTHSQEALKFARYLAARDKGLPVFQALGYQPLEEGDVFAPKPKIQVFGGAMVRPAIEATLEEFKVREGIDILTSFDGCGNLVAVMETKTWPDLFFACDPRFMKMVQQRFDPPLVVSQNRLVIAVPKDNPFGIQRLRDLGKEAMNVGVGHEQQCALGTITRETFLAVGVYGQVKKNVKLEAPTGDMLINQLRAKGLDAVVAYESNVIPYNDIVGIPIQGEIDCAPLQPVAVLKDSPNRQLTYRLVKALTSPVSRERFEKLGFSWQLPKAH